MEASPPWTDQGAQFAALIAGLRFAERGLQEVNERCAGTLAGRQAAGISREPARAVTRSDISELEEPPNLADDAAAKQEHADHEDHADDHRDPAAEAGEVVAQT